MKVPFSISAALSLSLLLLELGSVIGCSSSATPQSGTSADPQGSSARAEDQETVPPSQIYDLYQSDIQAFSNLDQDSVSEYDGAHQQLFTKIFGGTDSASVLKFYQDRIQYAFAEDDLSRASLSPASMQDDLTRALAAPVSSSGKSARAGALNVSTTLWLDGVVNYKSISLTVGSQQIALDSPHTGIMMFGPSYTDMVYDSQGDSHPFPPEYRQNVLLHEARHSDCTGGISREQISTVRAARSMSRLPIACGHTHINCPSGPLKGLPACDAERFGAYTVGATYIAATIDGQTDEISRKILQMTLIDLQSRFIESSSNPSLPDEQEPNMTSEGVIQ
jgi:hypothetical protein